jgi:hypothetical protein
VAVGGQYLEVFSKIAVDGGRFGRRFNDQQFDSRFLFSRAMKFQGVTARFVIQ